MLTTPLREEAAAHKAKHVLDLATSPPLAHLVLLDTSLASNRNLKDLRIGAIVHQFGVTDEAFATYATRGRDERHPDVLDAYEKLASKLATLCWIG